MLTGTKCLEFFRLLFCLRSMLVLALLLPNDAALGQSQISPNPNPVENVITLQHGQQWYNHLHFENHGWIVNHGQLENNAYLHDTGYIANTGVLLNRDSLISEGSLGIYNHFFSIS